MPDYPERHARQTLSVKQKIALIEAQGKRCAACQGCPRKFEFDHIVELWAGGSNEPGNWQALCRDCHVTKSGKARKQSAKEARLRGETGQWKRRMSRRKDYTQTKSGAIRLREPEGEMR